MLQRMDHHRRFNLQRNRLTKRNRIQQSVYRRSASYMSSNSSLSTEVFTVALCSQLELTKGGNARKRRRRKRDRRVTQRRAVIISVTSASPSLSSSTLAAAAAAAAARRLQRQRGRAGRVGRSSLVIWLPWQRRM